MDDDDNNDSDEKEEEYNYIERWNSEYFCDLLTAS